jgi:hypothetical protein
MVHWKIFVPKPRAVIFVVEESEFVMVPLPEIRLQVPVPVTGVFAAIVVIGLEIQIVWLGPALAVVGAGFTIIATVDAEDAHGELEMVHWKIFVPVPSPVTDVIGESEFVIVPLPEIKVHAPVPIIGAFAAMVVTGFEMQSV